MILTALLVASTLLVAQDLPDRSFRPMIEDRAYAVGTGPAVCLHEGHPTLTLNDGLWPLGELLRRDGFVVRAATRLDTQALDTCRVLVVAGRFPSEHVQEIYRWVASGGSLLLIADQTPLAAAGLAAAFGVSFADRPPARPILFRTADGTLRPHAIARGRHAKESVASVTAVAGPTLRAPARAEPVLAASDGSLLGAVMRVESGRAAFFSDAALFTARIVGPDRRLVGMNARGAERNFHFVLNVMHWLSGLI